jgi:hypothetical protein
MALATPRRLAATLLQVPAIPALPNREKVHRHPLKLTTKLAIIEITHLVDVAGRKEKNIFFPILPPLPPLSESAYKEECLKLSPFFSFHFPSTFLPLSFHFLQFSWKEWRMWKDKRTFLFFSQHRTFQL